MSAYLTGQSSEGLPVSMTPDGLASPLHAVTHAEVRPRLMGVILSVAACLIISTNLLVAGALLRLLLRRGSQSWCFVFNLALADTLVGVSITGLATEDFNSNAAAQDQLGLHANSTPPAARGKTRCLMRMAFVMSPCTASILSMFLISLDRYAAIKMPLRYSLLSGKGTAVGALLALWISSLALGFSPVMVLQLRSKKHYDGYCTFFSVIDEVGIIALFSVCFFPVLSSFVYIYLDILKIACGHQRQICQVRQASSRTAGDPRLYQQHPQQLRSFYWSHVKALRTVALLVGCFLLLWCPFFVVCIVHILCRSCALKDELESFLWLLGLSNSLINPLVYACWQREVRLQLAAVFSCVAGRSQPARPSGVTDRCASQPAGQTPACVSAGQTINPALLQPITNIQAATTNL